MVKINKIEFMKMDKQNKPTRSKPLRLDCCEIYQAIMAYDKKPCLIITSDEECVKIFENKQIVHDKVIYHESDYDSITKVTGRVDIKVS